MYKERSYYTFTDDEYDRFVGGEEVWKDVVGYEGLYQVSTDGRIKSLDRVVDDGKGNKSRRDGRILKKGLIKSGYFLVSLWKNGYGKMTRVHRASGNTFIHNPENKETINHIDGNKTNNTLENLEHNTQSENTRHAYRVLGRRSSMFQKTGVLNHNSRPILKYTINGEFIAEYASMSDAWREAGIRHGNISMCCSGKRNNAGGFVWRYKNVDK